MSLHQVYMKQHKEQSDVISIIRAHELILKQHVKKLESEQRGIKEKLQSQKAQGEEDKEIINELEEKLNETIMNLESTKKDLQPNQVNS